jgi:hypothetical protein
VREEDGDRGNWAARKAGASAAAAKKSAAELMGEGISKIGAALATNEALVRKLKERASNNWLLAPVHLTYSAVHTLAAAILRLMRYAYGKLEWRDAVILGTVVYLGYPATYKLTREVLRALSMYMLKRLRSSLAKLYVLSISASTVHVMGRARRLQSAAAEAIAGIHGEMATPVMQHIQTSGPDGPVAAPIIGLLMATQLMKLQP